MDSAAHKDVTRQFVSPLGGCGRSGHIRDGGLYSLAGCNYRVSAKGAVGRWVSYNAARERPQNRRKRGTLPLPSLEWLHCQHSRGDQKTGRRCRYGSRDSDATGRWSELPMWMLDRAGMRCDSSRVASVRAYCGTDCTTRWG